MELWDRLLSLLRRKPGSARRYFELDEPLHAALEERADLEQLPVEQIQAELLADGLKQYWETLSRREQQVTALTCLGYTNRQMAARMQLSPTTIKGYMSDAL